LKKQISKANGCLRLENNRDTEANSPEIRAFIRAHDYLFWWIRDEAKENISLNLLVESVLHYGDIRDIRGLFELIGIGRTADIFREQISRKRVPYPARTVHFFKLYFRKHAPGYSE